MRKGEGADEQNSGTKGGERDGQRDGGRREMSIGSSCGDKKKR